jgi:protease I
MLLEAGLVAGRRLTFWPSIRTDLRNAGATVVDEEVVVDGQLTNSRSPADLEASARRSTSSSLRRASKRTPEPRDGQEVARHRRCLTLART